jgi:Fur family ferric uptake transcriptional regulator
MKEVNQVFSEYLKKKELKNTPERFTILDEIIKWHKHFEADALLVHLKTKNKKISRATIYRTLELLVDCGLVKKVTFNHSQACYEPVSGLSNHDHFICEQCGKIIEFYDASINRIHDHLQAHYGLEVLHYTYHLYGRCTECKRKKGPRK